MCSLCTVLITSINNIIIIITRLIILGGKFWINTDTGKGGQTPLEPLRGFMAKVCLLCLSGCGLSLNEAGYAKQGSTGQDSHKPTPPHAHNATQTPQDACKMMHGLDSLRMQVEECKLSALPHPPTHLKAVL